MNMEKTSTGAELVPAASTDLVEVADVLVERARADGVELTGEGGPLIGLIRRVMQTALEAEMTEYLGYEPHASEGRGTGYSRNGTYPKMVRTEAGAVDVRLPRDRNGSFDSVTVPKGVRRIDGLDAMVILLHAKGMTTGDIAAHLTEICGQAVSKHAISRITDAIVEWQHRPLDAAYQVILIAASVVGRWSPCRHRGPGR